ncbi:MAG: hypothetical protein V1863_01970 [Candidatus Omnitrophota bacterium]
MPDHNKKNPISPVAIWKKAFDVILSYPKVFVPFIILGLVETLALFFLAASPHYPVNLLMAEPIRRIKGEIFLHYPYIYEILPSMFYYAKMALGVVIGSVTTASAVVMVSMAAKKETIKVKHVLRIVFKNYLSLILLSALLFVVAHFVLKQPTNGLLRYFRAHENLLFLGPKQWLYVILPIVNFILAVVLQGFFVFAFPYIVLRKKKFLAALLLGIRLFFKTFLKTFTVIAVPMLLYVPVTMLRGSTVILAQKFAPEVIVGILGIGILVGTVIVDAMVTVAATVLFIEKTSHEE